MKNSDLSLASMDIVSKVNGLIFYICLLQD